MPVRMEIKTRVNGIVHRIPITDSSILVFKTNSSDQAILKCDDPELRGRKQRRVRNVIFSRRGMAELQLAPNRAIEIHNEE